MNENMVLASLKKNLHKILPKGQKVFEIAAKKELTGRENDIQWIKKNFSNLVENIQVTAYDVYKTEEKKSVAYAFRETLKPLLSKTADADEVFQLLEEQFWALDKFFLSLTQGRRPRAGKAFEYVIKLLFDKLGYPYTPQPIINGQPDFLLPSHSHFKKNAMDCIIFTVKRTLRERWRQIVTEGTRGYLFFLATIDEEIAARDLSEIRHHRIYLVVPDRLKTEIYSNQPNVISFETFFEQHLDPAMTRWQTNNII